MDSFDEFKEMVLDTNRNLFLLGIVVGLLHSVFDILAMKNDIQYWNNLKSYEGLSLRGLYTSFAF